MKQQHHITYELKRFKKQKRINMHVRCGGDVLVTAPWHCTQRQIDAVVAKNSTWINEQQQSTKGQKDVTIDARVTKHIKKNLHNELVYKLEQFNRHYGLSYARVTVRQQRTRWGSCSSKGNLSFNLRLACLTEDLRDYVIVHELCHLREMNHSPAFWALVAQTVPDYKERRRALKHIAF